MQIWRSSTLLQAGCFYGRLVTALVGHLCLGAERVVQSQFLKLYTVKVFPGCGLSLLARPCWLAVT